MGAGAEPRGGAVPARRPQSRPLWAARLGTARHAPGRPPGGAAKGAGIGQRGLGGEPGLEPKAAPGREAHPRRA